jgi:hypothetical protein
MLPRIVAHDSFYGCSIDSESKREPRCGQFSCRVKATNLADFRFSMFPVSIRFATRNPTLFNTIGSILLLRAQPEMRRINARRMVSAWAVVANTHPIRDAAKVNHPTDAVRPPWSAINFNVAIPLFETSPQPTITWSSFVHVSPKAILDFGRNLRQKAASRIRIHTAGWVRTRWSFARLLRPFFLSGSPFSVNY